MPDADLSDGLFLSLRTCATHPAGPLRAVAEVQLAIDRGDLTREEAVDLARHVRERFAAIPGVPDDRVETVRLFVAALWH